MTKTPKLSVAKKAMAASEILKTLDADEIRKRLADLAAEREGLLILLRAAIRQEQMRASND